HACAESGRVADRVHCEIRRAEKFGGVLHLSSLQISARLFSYRKKESPAECRCGQLATRRELVDVRRRFARETVGEIRIRCRHEAGSIHGPGRYGQLFGWLLNGSWGTDFRLSVHSS